MTDALKPCPFCGGEALVGETFDWTWYVQCSDDDCAPVFHYYAVKAEAIAAWNTRHGEADICCKQDYLHDATPNCDGTVGDAPGGGVRCSKCSGWFCY